jgi:hypothetical protein
MEPDKAKRRSIEIGEKRKIHVNRPSLFLFLWYHLAKLDQHAGREACFEHAGKTNETKNK